MSNPSIKYGVYGSIAIILLDLLLSLISPTIYITWASWVSLLIIIPSMYMVSKEFLESNDGLGTLGELFKANWLSYLIMGLITTVFGYILVTYISPEITEIATEKAMEAIEMMRGFMGEEAADKAISDIEGRNPYGMGSQLGGLIFKYAMAAVPAVIIAAFA